MLFTSSGKVNFMEKCLKYSKGVIGVIFHI